MSEAVLNETNIEVNQEVTTKTESKPIVPICQHIKDNGLRCGTPALNGRHFCYYHCRAHFPGARILTRKYRAPIPETVASLQVALAHTMQALTSGDMTPKQANSALWSIQLGMNLLRQSSALTKSELGQVVTEIPEAMQSVLVEPEPKAEPKALKLPEREPEPEPLTEEQLRANVLTQDQLIELYEHMKSIKGTPAYDEAVTRLYAHREAQVALGRLQNQRKREAMSATAANRSIAS